MVAPTPRVSPKPGMGKAYMHSMDMLREEFPNEDACRRFLEDAIWPDGRYCPHCGSLSSWAIAGRSARRGLYECKDCHRQFTVTTKTPMHGTKLPLWRWIQAMWLMLSSSKGISSVVLGRWVGLPQKTAWRLMQNVRELLTVAEWCADQLTGMVQVDAKFLGGAPRRRKGVKHKRGRGTHKPLLAIAIDGDGFVRAQPIRSESSANMESFFDRAIDRSSWLVSDKSSSVAKLATDYAGHTTVNHSQDEFSIAGVHSNSAEAFAAKLERTLIGVYHWMSRWHLFRYVGGAAFRWNRKEPIISDDGDETGEYERQHAKLALTEAFRHAIGVELRRTIVGGIKYPGDPEPAPRRLRFLQARTAKSAAASPILSPEVVSAIRRLVGQPLVMPAKGGADL